MATLVWTADEEPTLVVAKFIAEISWGGAGEDITGPAVAQVCGEAESLLAVNRFADLVNLLLTSADTVLSKASDKDIECIFGVIINFVSKAASAAETESMAGSIAAKLLAAPDKAALKIKLLFSLYNILPSLPSLRFNLFLRVLKFATTAKAADLLLPSLASLDTLVADWGISRLQKRDVFAAAAALLKESKTPKEASRLTLRYLATFEEGDDVGAAEVVAAAAEAAADFVRAADAFESDLLRLPAVQHLASTAEHAALFQLLSILLTGSFQDYKTFVATNASLLQSLGVSAEESETKARLLTLAGLAADSTASGGGVGEIRYAVIKDSLQISEDDVEPWVIRAIAAKVLSAKMDQLRKVAIITRKTQRVFGPTEWKELRSKLLSWRENIGGVYRVIHNTRASNSVVPSPSPATTTAY